MFDKEQIQIVAEIRNPHTMELETLKDLYIHELKDLHSAEKQLTKALPKMAKAATNESLADGFRLHLDQTEEHVNRLEQILESHKESTRGPKCKGMEGLIEEGSEMIEEDAEDEVREFIEHTQLPFLATPMGKGVMPDDHPQSAAPARSFVLQNADLVFLMGADQLQGFLLSRPLEADAMSRWATEAALTSTSSIALR